MSSTKTRTATVTYAEQYAGTVKINKIVPEKGKHLPFYFMPHHVATFGEADGEPKGNVLLTAKHIVAEFEWEGRKYQYRANIEEFVNECINHASTETEIEKRKAQWRRDWEEIRDAAMVLFKTFGWRESGGSGPTNPLFTKDPKWGESRAQPYIGIYADEGRVKYSVQQEATAGGKSEFPLTVGGITDAINKWEMRVTPR